MRRRCKHENASDKYGECTFDMVGNIVYEVEFRECLDCGEWQPMGPARDTEQTAIEVRAAEIAASGAPNDHTRYRDGGCEYCGWHHMFEGDPDDGTPANHAGYLARCIVETEEGLTSVSTGDKVNHGKP